MGRISRRPFDAQLVDPQPQERFRLLRLGLGVELVGDGGEVGGRGRVCRLVWRLEREFGWQEEP